MAYRTRRSSRRTGGYSRSARSARRPTRRRSVARRSTGRRSIGGTLRIVVQSASPSDVARPPVMGVMPAPKPRKARF